jgi:uroporphyrin-III C-methyltransferase/precorrin-2 dehydrogenase/sirohydrochlorin ferrochelatase
MRFLPIFMDLRDQPCVVVGAGEVAARKIRLLLEAGARVRVVDPRPDNAVRRMDGADRLTFVVEAFRPEHLDEAVLAIAATGDPAVNRSLSAAARQRRIPVNVVDRPSLCSFIMPSIVDRSPVVIAVSTGGASPVLARQLRSRLETLIPAAYGRLAVLVERFRETVARRIPSTTARKDFWERVLSGPIPEMLFAGREHDAVAALERAVGQAGSEEPARGEVYLVGAGPGDPDLLTFRALRLMQQADVVLYDRLVAREILSLVRRDAERIYVGKARAAHAVPQARINDLLVSLAREGKRVLRLKGGDPFIFGRGGEEIADLARNGIPFQVVPGITAAAGCASYAGIPLTHRDHAQSCLFVTGQLRDGSVDLNWRQLCQPRQTVVVYMALTGLDVLCREMIRHGSPATTPAALVEQGTTRRQRVFTGTLATLPGVVAGADVHAPTLIIVGDVVRLHDTLGWFDPASEAAAGDERPFGFSPVDTDLPAAPAKDR